MKGDPLIRGRAPGWISGPASARRRGRIHWLPLLVALLVALALRQVIRVSAEVQGLSLPGGVELARRIGHTVVSRICSPDAGR